MEWAQVRAMAADGISQREIAARLGINRRTVARLAGGDEPPHYEPAPAGSMLDPLEPVLRRLIEEWPDIKAPRVTELLRDDYGYAGQSIWSASESRCCGRAPSGRRSARATGPGR